MHYPVDDCVTSVVLKVFVECVDTDMLSRVDGVTWKAVVSI